MSKVLVNSDSLTNIAEAIRGKLSTEDKYKPSEMAAAIASIVGGGAEVTYACIDKSGSNPTFYYDFSNYITDPENQILLVQGSYYSKTTTTPITFMPAAGSKFDIASPAYSINAVSATVSTDISSLSKFALELTSPYNLYVTTTNYLYMGVTTNSTIDSIKPYSSYTSMQTCIIFFIKGAK